MSAGVAGRQHRTRMPRAAQKLALNSFAGRQESEIHNYSKLAGRRAATALMAQPALNATPLLQCGAWASWMGPSTWIQVSRTAHRKWEQ